MICKLRRQEPSLSSMKEKSFESRRVRTQPWTKMDGTGPALCSASFTEVGAIATAALIVLIRKPGMQEKQLDRQPIHGIKHRDRIEPRHPRLIRSSRGI